jgi:hypothetical protein
MMKRWRTLAFFLLTAGLIGFSLQVAAQQEGKKSSPPEKQEKKGTDEKETKKSLPPLPEKAEGLLAPKAFAGKESFYQVLHTVTKQKMSVMGMTHEQTQDQTFYFQWTPKEHKDDTYVVVQKILGLKMDIDIAGNKISYDSTAKQQPKNPMTEFFKQLLGQEFTLTIKKNKEGRYVVEKVEGVNALVQKLENVNKQMGPLLRRILNEETVKHMAEPMLGIIPPNGNLPANGSWETSALLDLGPIGKYTTKNIYSASEKERKGNLLPIQVKSVVEYAKPESSETSALPFRIKDATLKSKEASGTVDYNLDKGRVENAKLTVRLEGDLTIEVSNMETTVHLEQTQESTLTASDQEPAVLRKQS